VYARAKNCQLPPWLLVMLLPANTYAHDTAPRTRTRRTMLAHAPESQRMPRDDVLKESKRVMR
jgi:hypothetical protein